jgi:hypothetical protein
LDQTEFARVLLEDMQGAADPAGRRSTKRSFDRSPADIAAGLVKHLEEYKREREVLPESWSTTPADSLAFVPRKSMKLLWFCAGHPRRERLGALGPFRIF